MAALTSLNYNQKVSPSWTAALAVMGLTNNTANANNKQRAYSLSSAVANAVAGGADTIYAVVSTIAASGTLTIDLTSFADIMGRTGTSMARLKAYHIRLLDVTDDAAIVAQATSVTVGGGANAHRLNQTLNTTTFDLGPGESQEWITPGAAGIVTDGTHKNVKVLNNDATNAAKVLVILVGGTS